MLEIALLGGRGVRDALGAALPLSARTHALIAFLVLHAGVAQSRSRMAAMFWPDSTDEQALTNLRRELHHLRRALGDDASLVVTARELCWSDTSTCRVDLRTFELGSDAAVTESAAGRSRSALAHATAALDSYGGDLLPDSYDEWVVEARAELEQRLVDLLDLSCTARLALGDLTGAAAVARRRIQCRPLEEVGYRRLIELQGDLGDRAGAVSTYHHCASVLERELGIEPARETRQTLERLMTRTASRAEPTPVTASPRAGRYGPVATPLVGRDTELGVLADLWDAGRPQLALVRGDPGVGKTRLVGELVRRARAAGAVTATARCFGTAGQLALAPVAEWLRTPAVQAELATLDPVWRDEVERLVPARSVRAAPPPGGNQLADAWQRHRFVEGLARALLSIGRPTLLVLDDVQWCDEETLAFIAFLLGIAGDARIVIAATMRNDHESGPTDWTARLRARGMLTAVTLKPLEPADTTRLAEAVSGRRFSSSEIDLLHAATGGFPLHIVEARRGDAGGLGGELPVGDLRAVLRNRFEQVSAAAQEVAGLAAAVGRNFDLELLTEASDLDADTVVHAVDELWAHRILREVGDGYDFSHDLLRETAYSQVSPARRWLLHRRLAQCLELLHADDPDVVSAQLAEQSARGGRGERAVAHFRRAAEVAASRFAHAEGIRLLTEALTIVRALPAGRDRDAQELALLETIAAPLNAHHGYSSTELRAVLERSITLAEQLGRRRSLLVGLVGLWGAQFVHGYALEAYRTAERALSAAHNDPDLIGAANFAVGGSSLTLGRPAQALHHLELAARFDDSHLLTIGTRPDVHGRAYAAHAHWLLGDDAKAVASSDAAITLARAGESPYNVAVALAYAGVTAQLRGDVTAVRTVVSELHELCARYDFAYYREWALVLDGWTRDDAHGVELARRGVRNLIAQRAFARLPYWLSLVADVAARAGQPDAARARLDAALSAGHARGDLWWLPEVLRMRAAYDERRVARARLESAAAMASEHGSVALLARCTADLAARSEVAPRHRSRPLVARRPERERSANGPFLA